MIHLTSVLKGQLDPVFSSKDEHYLISLTLEQQSQHATCFMINLTLKHIQL